MKKFKIKTLLVIVMTVMMSLSLAACNDGKKGGGGGGGGGGGASDVKTTLNDFFDSFMVGLKDKGATPLVSSDDLHISADLDVTIGNVNDKESNRNTVKDGRKFVSKTTLGAKIDVILDRTSSEADGAVKGTHSAFKIEFTNKNAGAVNGGVLFSVAYFLDTPTSYFVEFAGQKVEVAMALLDDADAAYSAGFNELLSSDSIETVDENGEPIKISVDEILNSIINGTGNGWSAINAINGILKDTGLMTKLKGMLETDMIKGILESLKIEVIDKSTGNINFAGIMGALNGFFNTVSRRDGNTTSYKTTVLPDLLSKIGPALGESPLMDIITKSNISIGFDKVGDKTENIKIMLDMLGATITKAGVKQYPYLCLAINNFNIEKVDAITDGKVKDTLLGTATTYATEFTFNQKSTISLKGVTINPMVLGVLGNPSTPNNLKSYSVDMSGNYVLESSTIIDLKTKGAENKTHMYMSISKDNIKLGEIEFNGMAGQAVVRFHNDVKAPTKGLANDAQVSYMQALVESLGAAAIKMIAAPNDNLTQAENDQRAQMAVMLLKAMFKDVDTAMHNDKLQIKIGGVYYYYTPEYSGMEGVVIDGIDIVGSFQKKVGDMITKITAPKPPTTPEDPSAPKLVRGWTILPDLNGIIIALARDITTNPNGAEFNSPDTGLASLIRAMIVNKDGDYGLNNNSKTAAQEIFALLLVTDEMAAAFKDLGVVDNATAYELSREETVNIYRYMAKCDGYNKEKYIADFKTANGDVGPSGDQLRAFDNITSKSMIGILGEFFAGSKITGSDSNNKLIALLTDGILKANVKAEDGKISFGFSFTEDDNSRFGITVDGSIWIATGDDIAAVGTIENVPTVEELENGALTDVAGKGKWLLFQIPKAK